VPADFVWHGPDATAPCGNGRNSDHADPAPALRIDPDLGGKANQANFPSLYAVDTPAQWDAAWAAWRQAAINISDAVIGPTAVDAGRCPSVGGHKVYRGSLRKVTDSIVKHTRTFLGHAFRTLRNEEFLCKGAVNIKVRGVLGPCPAPGHSAEEQRTNSGKELAEWFTPTGTPHPLLRIFSDGLEQDCPFRCSRYALVAFYGLPPEVQELYRADTSHSMIEHLPPRSSRA
jgi:hypothetical protein